MEYDLIIVLGSQIMKNSSRYFLAPHTELKARAAGIAWQKGYTDKFIVSGGYNFYVLYDKFIFLKPDFSFEAFQRARAEKSEAEVIKNFMITNYKVLPKKIFLEETSSTLEEKAAVIKIILQRTTFANMKRIAILTMLYHMEKSLSLFKNAGLKVEPIFAEDLLVLENPAYWIPKIIEYYSTPKGGKQWKLEKINQNFKENKSIGNGFLLV